MMLKGFWVILLGAALGLGLVARPGLAQSAGRVSLLPPDLTQFPKVSFQMEAYTPGGEFMADLSDRDIQIIEDGAARPVEGFTRLQSGLHLVAAINTAPALAVQQGSTTLMEQVRQSLLAWCARQPGNGLDEFSLVGNSGGQATKLRVPADWAAALRDFSPDLLRGQASLISLTQAFDLVTDAGRRTSSKRAVLWITPPLPDNSLAALPNLGERASQLGARLFVWLVVPPGSGETKSHSALADLARRTGGQFAVFGGGAPIPDLETWFNSLRYIYQVSYTSLVRASGGHRLQVQLIRDEANPATGEARFNLTLAAPNPIFLSPPVSIRRVWAQTSPQAKPYLRPQQTEVALLVEFPDNLKRALTATRLYVNGKLASQSADPAPVSVVWPLGEYTTSQRVAIRVEVEDILGFKRSSIEIPVDLEVEPAPAPAGFDAAFFTSDENGLVVGGALVGVMLVGAVVWVIRRRARFAPVKTNRAWEAPHLSVPAFSQRRAALVKDAPARLVRLTEDGQALQANSLPLPFRELILGSDPRKASVVVESSSVDGVHARIRPNGEQGFILMDAGSLAGTWVNFEPVGVEGVSLQHGDLVHLGRESYRFELKQPRQTQFLHIRRLDEGQSL